MTTATAHPGTTSDEHTRPGRSPTGPVSASATTDRLVAQLFVVCDAQRHTIRTHRPLHSPIPPSIRPVTGHPATFRHDCAT